MLNRRPTCLIGNLDMLHQRPIWDRHAHLRPTCISETDIPERRPTGNRHALSETDMSDRRPTCRIGDRHVGSETDIHALLGDTSETDMPNQLGSFHYSNINKQKVYKNENIFIHLFKFRLVSDGSLQACRSPMGLRSGISVSGEACRGLRSCISVFDGSPNIYYYIIFSCTRKKIKKNLVLLRIWNCPFPGVHDLV